ncbi:MAG TPA: response regulator transcription factor [Caulobacteraceae bacterium]|nr:response regulator transcription factor [Caulobacteraceae bacterium]
MPEPGQLRVVVVEDESFTRRAIAIALREAGFEVVEAADAFACRAVLKQGRADAIVLDLGLPGCDGMEFAAELRAQGDIGLVIVSRRSAPETRIQALDIGADDYLVKPIHGGELAARVRSVLRRRQAPGGELRRLGRWKVDLQRRIVSAGVTAAPLTRGEFEVLSRLIEADGKIVGREDLLAAASRREASGDLRSVDALVSRLRRKLGDVEEDLIATAPGFGYRLAKPTRKA